MDSAFLPKKYRFQFKYLNTSCLLNVNFKLVDKGSECHVNKNGSWERVRCYDSHKAFTGYLQRWICKTHASSFCATTDNPALRVIISKQPTNQPFLVLKHTVVTRGFLQTVKKLRLSYSSHGHIIHRY